MTAEIFWPASRIGEGLELLARAAGLPVRGAPGAPGLRGPGLQGPGDLRIHASALGLHAEPVETSAGQVAELLRGAAPAVVRADDDRFVMIVRARGGRLTIVRPDLRVTTIPAGLVRQAIVEPIAAPLTAETARLVEEAGVRPSKRPALVAALLAERLRDRRVEAGWVLRVQTGGGVRAQLAASGARRQLMLLVLAHAAQYAMWVVAWWLLGSAALQGRLDAAWLGAWTIALCTVVPLQLVTLWLQGRLSIVVGALLKQRLLAGAFGLEAEHVRREGAGRLLGRVIEAQAVESLALGGGFLALLAILELALAAGILALASPLLTILLLVWIVATAALAWRYSRRRQTWVGLRVGLTHDLIERMAGHRTRLAQQPRERWHDGEDEALERYVQASAQMDRATVWLLALVPRGWILIGLCGLTPLFLRGGSPAALAIGLGGILLGFRAFDRLTGGLWNLAGAAIAWRQTAPVFKAAASGDQHSGVARASASTASARSTGQPGPALEASDLWFTHAGRGAPVLRGCNLALGPGDRAILQGSSGSGKSTLASLMAGLRPPQSGLLLIGGLDRHTLGLDGWRERIVLVPQFHENHVVLGTVAFNLLMGVEWPAGESEFARAEGVCRELGLGDVLDRMPSGVLQTIGETGWQLSHGERSRLFLARALLQERDVLILDESFAQLDPVNMQLALDAVVSRGKSVLLIAHP